MRRLILAAGLVLAMGAATAGDMYRFGGGVVSVGDSIAALLKRAGQPDRIVQLENAVGAAVGERWDYYEDGKLVSFEITGGRIQRISETR